MNTKTIDGVVHVWSIADNTWVTKESWDAIERARTDRERLTLLREIAELTPLYRGGIIPSRRVNGTQANALVRRDLLSKHTVPHPGYKLTDAGRALLAEASDDNA